MNDDLLSLFNFIKYQISKGEYSGQTMEPIIKVIKKELGKSFLEQEFNNE